MDIATQMKIRSNPNLYYFLREESHWYKYLNRDPNIITEIEKEMKKKYKLTLPDKLDKINESISMINNFMDVIK